MDDFPCIPKHRRPYLTDRFQRCLQKSILILSVRLSLNVVVDPSTVCINIDTETHYIRLIYFCFSRCPKSKILKSPQNKHLFQRGLSCSMWTFFRRPMSSYLEPGLAQKNTSIEVAAETNAYFEDLSKYHSS